MIKYYTRACNFYYSTQSKFFNKKRRHFPFVAIKIAFDRIEIITRKKKKISSKIINFRKIKSLSNIKKKKLKKI